LNPSRSPATPSDCAESTPWPCPSSKHAHSSPSTCPSLITRHVFRTPRRQQSSQRRPCRFLCMQIAGAAPLRSPPEMIALCWHRRVQQRYGGRRGTNPRRNYGANGAHVHESFRCELAEAFLRPLRRSTSTRSHSHTLVGRSGRQEIASRVRGPLYSHGCWRQRSRACRPSCCRRTRCRRVVAVHFARHCSVTRLSPFSRSRAISSVTTAQPKSLPCSA